MSFAFGIGSPRIKLLASDGTTSEAILYLPATALGGITLSFDENKQVDEMLDGTMNVTVKGYYHRYACRWDVYDPESTNKTIGIADGNTPTVDQLIQIFTSYRPGRLLFSPSETAAFYSVFLDKLPKVLPISDYATAFDFEVKTLAMYVSADNSSGKYLA